MKKNVSEQIGIVVLLFLLCSIISAFASLTQHCTTTGITYSNCSGGTCSASNDTCNSCGDGIIYCSGGGGACAVTNGTGTYTQTKNGGCDSTSCTAIVWGTPTPLTVVCT